MKILITGQNSYIGQNFKIWITKRNPDFFVDFISVRDELPTIEKLSAYDVVIHLAAIVHKKNVKKEEYYKVNTILTEKLAILSKKANVSQFIFFSTMAVYGAKDKLKEKVIINKNTICTPTTYYGKSKLLAEKKISKLCDEQFLIAIMRPPMVYGEGGSGNYQKLYNYVKYTKIPVFPLVYNQRSMIHINTLSETLRTIIVNKSSGIFTPQDKKYTNTSKLVQSIAKSLNKKIYLSKILGFIVLEINTSFISKIFGNLVYDKE